MEPSDRRVLEGLRPYVVARPALWPLLNAAPLDLPRSALDYIDPTRVQSSDFLDRIERFDRLCFAPIGLSMPRWALYDCAELSGVVCGFAREASELRPEARSAFEATAGLLPISMAIAIPTVDPTRWLAYSLSSLDEAVPGSVSARTRLLSLAMLADLVPCPRLIAITQWRSGKLADYAQFAPLELSASWLPAHDDPATLVFELDASRAAIDRALRTAYDERRGDSLDVQDDGAIIELQRVLEEGERVHIVAPPRAGRVLVVRGGEA